MISIHFLYFTRLVLLQDEFIFPQLMWLYTMFPQFCSVGDDACLLLWDAATGFYFSRGVKVEKAYNANHHCVDWNCSHVYLVLNGSANETNCLEARQNMTSGAVGFPFTYFKSILNLWWCPFLQIRRLFFVVLLIVLHSCRW